MAKVVHFSRGNIDIKYYILCNGAVGALSALLIALSTSASNLSIALPKSSLNLSDPSLNKNAQRFLANVRLATYLGI